MDNWRRPTEEEAAQGCVAMLQHIGYCYVKDGYSLRAVPTGIWRGYDRIRMNRRVNRWRHDKTVELPYWIEPLESKAVTRPEHVAVIQPNKPSLDDIDAWLGEDAA